MTAFSSAIFFVAVFSEIMLREQKARREVQTLADKLSTANQKLREYSMQVELLAATQERNRLAREIHDGLGHYLTVVNVQIRAAQAVMLQNPTGANDALAKAQTMTEDALADVRRSVAALRGDSLLAGPLPEMVQQLVDETSASGLVGNFEIQGQVRALAPQVEMTLYRVVQESLTNVRKHALASQVEVGLEFRQESVRLLIQDNGIGAVQETAEHSPPGSFGLFGLRERVQLLGGTVVVQTAPKSGFCIQVEIPV
jgi:signal transduction histidine kinase